MSDETQPLLLGAHVSTAGGVSRAPAREWDAVWRRWDRAVGLRHLRCFHLNDSKTPFGSRRDRHEWVGEGTLGPEPFRRLMRDPRFREAIKVIETPKAGDGVYHDRRMLRRLRRYAKAPRG